jgi:hypothetical protein
MERVQIYCTLMHCINIHMFSMLLVSYDQRTAAGEFGKDHFMSSTDKIKAGTN